MVAFGQDPDHQPPGTRTPVAGLGYPGSTHHSSCRTACRHGGTCIFHDSQQKQHSAISTKLQRHLQEYGVDQRWRHDQQEQNKELLGVGQSGRSARGHFAKLTVLQRNLLLISIDSSSKNRHESTVPQQVFIG